MQFTEYSGVIGVRGYGALITVKPSDEYLMNRLVGNCNYFLTIYDKKNSADFMTWTVDYYTDGSDSDAGNGDFVAEKTLLSWTSGGS